MVANRRDNKQYFYTVEGETEKWYLDWLEDEINANLDADPSANIKVSIRSKVEKNPLKYAKSIPIITKVEITHLFDYEKSGGLAGRHLLSLIDPLS